MSASKRKGTSYESAVVEFLGRWFPHVERRALGGINDKGDVAGIPNVVLECKNEARIDLAGYMDEAKAEAANAGAPLYAAVVKRRGKNVSQSYVVMPLDVFAPLLQRITRLPDSTIWFDPEVR